MHHKTSTLALAAALVFTVPAMSEAWAARPAATVNATPRITGFDVEQVAQLQPGTELRFTLWGSPNAQAMLQINGAKRPLVMYESRPGFYEGTYTISTRDQIRPDASVDANLRLGTRVDSARLDEWLQNGAQRGDGNAMAEPQIDRFEVSPGGDASSGKTIGFRLTGTPGGRASVRMVGAQSRFRLDERAPGEYVGTYKLRPYDRIADTDPLVGMLRVGDRSVTTQVDDVSQLRQFSSQDTALCAECARVVEINRIEVAGDGNYIGGTIAGGVLGAILGSQVGGGRGRDVARVAGAVGGAVAGREIQKRNVDTKVHYDVVVQMRDNGERKVVTMDQLPDFKAGEEVRLRDGTLSRLR